MATEAPDPRSFQNWEEAFQYPVPTVRGMEKKLRNNLNENHDKLRTLVGGSYRDLLGTARTIINIDGQMHDVEQLLADASRKSDSRVLDKIAAQRARFHRQNIAIETSRLALNSQLTSLKSCLDVITRLLRTRGSTLVSAKLLIVARLLHKTLSSRSDVPSACVSLGSRLGVLRQKVLRHIDRRAGRHHVESVELTELMTAFSLATSSVPSATLSHFLRLRSEAIDKAGESSEIDVQSQIKRRIELFVGTLRLSKAVFPDLLGPSLRALGAGPVLSDQSIVNIEELNLDIHERWFSTEDRNFTPWSRHDELQRSKVVEMVKAWSAAMLKSLVSQMYGDLSQEENMESLAETRHAVLQMWLSSRRNAYGLRARDALSAFRSPFLERQKILIDNANLELSASLPRVITHAVDEHSRSSSTITNISIWHNSIIDASIQDGAKPFKNAILDRRHGRSAGLHAVIAKYDNYASAIQNVEKVLKGMRDAKWDDDYDDDSSSGSENDENNHENSVWQTLSRSDPEDLQKRLKQGFRQAILQLADILTNDFRSNVPSCTDATSPGIYLLRILRELRQRIPRLMHSIDSSTPQTPFCDSLIESLHADLADSIELKTSEAFQKSLLTSPTKPFHIRALWDGNPQIPVQPSPAIFKHLRVLVKEMEALAEDVWTADAVTRVKSKSIDTAAKAIGSTMEKIADFEESRLEEDKTDVGSTNEHNADAKEGSESNETEPSVKNANNHKEVTDAPVNSKNSHVKRDRLTQLLFDTLYLSHAFSPASSQFSSEPTPLGNLATELLSKTEMDETARARVKKNALEYWKRTYLLFGLLSSF